MITHKINRTSKLDNFEAPRPRRAGDDDWSRPPRTKRDRIRREARQHQAEYRTMREEKIIYEW